MPLLAFSALATSAVGCRAGNNVEEQNPQAAPSASISAKAPVEGPVIFDCSNSKMDLFVIYQIRLGKYEEALKCARTIPALDEKITAFNTIAKSLIDQKKDRPAALQTYKEALTVALNAKKDVEQESAIIKVVEAMAENNLGDEVLADIQSRPAEIKLVILRTLLRHLIQVKETSLLRDGIIVPALLSLELPKAELVKLVELSSGQSDRLSIYLTVALAQVKGTRPEEGLSILDEALKIIAGSPSDRFDSSNDLILGEIAIILVENNLLDKALKLNQQIQEPETRTYNTMNLAAKLFINKNNEQAALKLFKRAAAEAHALPDGPEQSARVLAMIAFTLAQTKLAPDEVINICNQALTAARKLKNTESFPAKDMAIDNILRTMIDSGLYPEALNEVLTFSSARRGQYYQKIITAMFEQGVSGDCFKLGQTIPMEKLGGYYYYFVKYFNWREHKGYSDQETIDLLDRLANCQVEEVNTWLLEQKHQRINYFRPTYEAVTVIGDIAFRARHNGDTQLIDYIRHNSLPKILLMLDYRNPRPDFEHGDYGYAYIIYPMKLHLFQALVNIGDPSSIPALSNCPELCSGDGYQSPIDNNEYYLGPAQKEAIEYLKAQKGANAFVAPPDLLEYGWTRGLFGFSNHPGIE